MVQRITFPLSLVKVIGLGLFLAGVSIRVVAVRTLGKYFSPELRTLQDHRLVDYGLYKYIRHPAYLGSFLFSVGIPLIFSSFYGFLLMLALFPCFLYKIKFEERMLLEKLGDEYREYRKKTKKILPLIY